MQVDVVQLNAADVVINVVDAAKETVNNNAQVVLHFHPLKVSHNLREIVLLKETKFNHAIAEKITLNNLDYSILIKILIA